MDGKTPVLYEDAWLAMREAAVALNEYREASTESFADADRIARTCRQHLYRIRPYFDQLGRQDGDFPHALEGALTVAETLMLAIHAIANHHRDDPDPWEALSAIGRLAQMLDEHTVEGTADRWAGRDQEFNEFVGQSDVAAAYDTGSVASDRQGTDKSNPEGPENVTTTPEPAVPVSDYDDDDVTAKVAEAALNFLIRDVPDPKKAQARDLILAHLVEEYRAAGGWLPKWLREIGGDGGDDVP